MNLSSVVRQGARYFPHKKALLFGNLSLTYAELNGSVEKVASSLALKGIKQGDRVILYSENRPEWVMIYYGVIRIGATVVCISPAYKSFELEHLLNDCKPALVVTSASLFPNIAECHNLPLSDDIWVIENDDVLSSLCEKKGDYAAGEFASIVNCQPDDVCVILYTGGTTGTPKGAMLTHRNILYTSQNICYHERIVPDDVGICFMPLNHVFGGNHIMNSIFYGCGTLALHKGFDIDEIISSIHINRVSRLYAVPTVYIRFLNNRDCHKYLRSVGYCFSAATSMPSEIVRQWHEAMGLNIHESYGMTETASLVTFNHLYRHKVGSVGTLAGLVEVKIVDVEGNELPTGERGEILIRGPNVMKGYFNKPEETKLALLGGWLHSGDVGLFDDEGYLYIVDRLKHLIITGGLNVFPTEVEEVLYSHGVVEECAVVGFSDKEYGEAVTAFIRLKKDSSSTPEDLIRFCKGKMASYKAPKKIFFVEDFPKSPQGKILKRELKKRFIEVS